MSEFLRKNLLEIEETMKKYEETMANEQSQNGKWGSNR